MKRIDAGRRHGHYDPRFWTGRRPGAGGQHSSDGEGFDVWENEGGAARSAPAAAARPRADWYAFSRRYFPGRRRHDLEVLVAWRDRGVGGPRNRDRSRSPAAR